MEIKKAVCVSSWNPASPSEILCHVIGTENEMFESVKYTSPFNSNDPAAGGFTAYPQKEDIVLIVQPSNSRDDEWYYMSTVVGIEVTEDNNFISNPTAGVGIESTDERMRSIGIKGNADQKLEFSDKATERTKYQALSLIDGGGGRLDMINGPNSSVNLQAGPDTRIKLAQGDSGASYQNPPDSLLAEAKGNASLESRGGALSLTVGPVGRKINIHNMASRFAMKAGPWDLESGDIDITSDRNSVNIRALSYLATETPSVYIEANRVIPTSVVQIRAGGNIDLIANAAVPGVGGISLETTGDIKLLAGGQVYINGTTVNLNNPAGFTPKIPTLSNYEKTLGFVPGA